MRKMTQLVVLLGLAGIVFPAHASTRPEAPPTTVIVVRHAEKLADGSSDPPLSAAGRRRAEELARMLGAAGVTNLYSTDLQRTRQTLAPLATATGLRIQEVAAGATDEQIRILQALPPGAVAVVAGHSNTVPAIVRGLGGQLGDTSDTEHGEMLDENAYDRMFLVIRPGKNGETAAVQTLELRYGEARD